MPLSEVNVEVDLVVDLVVNLTSLVVDPAALCGEPAGWVPRWHPPGTA